MHAIDYIIVSFYLLAIVTVGLVLQRRASTGIDAYFLGDRKLPWWALSASGMTSNTDIAGTMINVALFYALGTLGFFIEIRGGVVLVLAFLMIFMGKWARRSRVMTNAEWMHLRFGAGRQGDTARLISAVANIILTIAMISYFAIGAGKFAGEFLGLNWETAALLMAALALVYTVASGLFGVVWTDVLQGVFIFAAIVLVCVRAMSEGALPEQFAVSVPLAEGGFQTVETSLSAWTTLVPPLHLELPGAYSIYNLFGVALMFYFFRITLEGSSGAAGYMLQRYLSARSDREAGLLSLLWTTLLMFRWPMIAAIAMLGIHYGITHSVIADPELVLPTVINTFLPAGIKGLVLAAFMAAAMSTFDSTVNAGAAYWVKDIYQAYINPRATEKSLVRQSRIVSVMIVALGLFFSFSITNINEIWGWITMGIGAGLLIPQTLRWYWSRFNGYGYAAGTAAGMATAIVLKLFAGSWPEYYLFCLSISASLLGCLAGTFLSATTDTQVLAKFYRITRPFGWWNSVRSTLPDALRNRINRENRRDIIATFIAVPWQLTLFLTGIMVILQHWQNVLYLGTALLILSLALYFIWYRHLSEEVAVDGERGSE